MTFKGSLVTISPPAPLPDFAKIFDPLSRPSTSTRRTSRSSRPRTRATSSPCCTTSQQQPGRRPLVRVPPAHEDDGGPLRQPRVGSVHRPAGVRVHQLGDGAVGPVGSGRGGGIWISANYAGRGWRKSPQPIGGFVQSGTAGAVAALFTLLARSLVVDPGSSGRMRELLLKRAYPGAGSSAPSSRRWTRSRRASRRCV